MPLDVFVFHIFDLTHMENYHFEPFHVSFLAMGAITKDINVMTTILRLFIISHVMKNSQSNA